MISLILIILLIISLAKPDILLSKKIKDKATEEQQQILIKNSRKLYGTIIFLIEAGSLNTIEEIPDMLILILEIIAIILFFYLGWPARKEISKINKELTTNENKWARRGLLNEK